jgi:hypothetical protein
VKWVKFDNLGEMCHNILGRIVLQDIALLANLDLHLLAKSMYNMTPVVGSWHLYSEVAMQCNITPLLYVMPLSHSNV